MKRLVVLGLLLLSVLGPLRAQGEVREGLVMQSQIMKKSMRYSIYLPPGFEASRRMYPVLYLLHGYTDDDSAWIHFGEMAQTMDDAILRRDVTPMIVVMPDGGSSWYVNNFDGSVRWEDYLLKELIPFIESRFRAHPNRRSRAIAGLSMGGYGSLVQCMHHPDVFGACAALSAAVYTDAQIQAFSDDDWSKVRAAVWGPELKGPARLTAHLQENNPLKLAATENLEKLRNVRWYLDCGDEDFLLPGNLALHQVMTDRGIPHALRVRGGSHVWTYWRSGLPAVLTFVTAAFRQN